MLYRFLRPSGRQWLTLYAPRRGNAGIQPLPGIGRSRDYFAAAAASPSSEYFLTTAAHSSGGKSTEPTTVLS